MGAGIDAYNSYAQRGAFHVIERQMAAALELFPIFAHAHVLRTWGGIVDVTPGRVADRRPDAGRRALRQLRLGHRRLQGHARVRAGCYAHTIAHDEPHALNAPFALERFDDRRADRRARRRRGRALSDAGMLLDPLPLVRAARRDRVPLRRPGAASPYPADPDALTDAEWAEYLFLRDNPKGPFAERWVHSAGCRRWFNVVRDTVTTRSSRVPPGEPPAVSGRMPAADAIDRAAAAVHVRRRASYRASRATRSPPRCCQRRRRASARSIYHGRPRGISPPGAEEPNALVQVERAACASRCCARPRSSCSTGWSRAALRRPRRASSPAPTTAALRQASHAHCDVLVVGGGRRPGSRRRDRGARPRGGARVDACAGGARLAARRREVAPRRSTSCRCACTRTTARRRLRRQLRRARRAAHGPPRRRAPPGVARERLWHVRARDVVLATGAHERPIVFADNDRPGIMLAGAARTYVNRYGVVPGARAVVFTTERQRVRAAGELAGGRGRRRSRRSCRRARTATRWSARHDGATSAGRTGVARSRVRRRRATVECDLLLVSGGWNPAVHLFSQAQGTLRWDAALGGFVPDRVPRRGTRSRAPRRDAPTTRRAVADGRGAGRRRGAATARRRGPARRRAPADRRVGGRAAGRPTTGDAVTSSTSSATPPSPTSGAPPAPGCARPSTSSATRRSAPRTTRARRPACSRSASLADAARRATSASSARPRSGRRTRRSRFAALAGRDRGARCRPGPHDPDPRLARRARRACSRTSASGSGRGTTRATARTWTPPCCASARPRATGVGDHGRLDARQDRRAGPGRGEFLDRIYTNDFSQARRRLVRVRRDVHASTAWSSTTASTIRLGRRPLPRHHDHRQRRRGARLVRGVAADRVAGAARALHVGHRAVGDRRDRRARARATWSPRSRPTSTCRTEAFPFMTIREATVAGMPARVCRISFSGELAYEVNVAGLARPRAVGGRAGGRRAATASRRTAPRRCTCCAPRRAT